MIHQFFQAVGTSMSCRPSSGDRLRSGHRICHAVVAAAFITAVACEPPSERSFDIELVTSPAAQAGTCPEAGAGGLVKVGQDGVRVVRITFFDARAGEPSVESFICDRLVAADEGGQTFYIDAPRDALLHIQVEAFGSTQEGADATHLIASGSLANVPFDDPKEAPRVFLPMAGRLGCALGTMNQARAFHSTTALPGGHALVVGGLVASSGGDNVVTDGRGMLLTDSVEFYDAATGRFTTVEVQGAAGVKRAFHRAHLLQGANAEEARVLLLGGIGQGTVPEGDGVVKIRQGPEHPFRVSPVAGAAPAAARLLTVDLTSRPPTITRSEEGLADWPAAYFQSGATYGQQGPVVAGGATATSSVPVGSFMKYDGIDLGFPDSGEHHPAPGTLLTPRVGLSLSTITPATALAWGGNLDQPDGLGTLAELITISPAPPSATALTYDAASSTAASPVPTVFHTATVLDGGDVLITGGFAIEAGIALDPADASPIHRVVLEDETFAMHGQPADGFVPVGYHAAVRLADGRVLITGGTPRRQSSGSCMTWTCSLGQAFLYTPAVLPTQPGTLEPLPDEGLVVPRFGHRMVLLESNLVLVTGGLRQDDGTLYTEASAEIFNSADASAMSDVPLGRDPATLYSPDSECPVF